MFVEGWAVEDCDAGDRDLPLRREVDRVILAEPSTAQLEATAAIDAQVRAEHKRIKGSYEQRLGFIEMLKLQTRLVLFCNNAKGEPLTVIVPKVPFYVAVAVRCPLPIDSAWEHRVMAAANSFMRGDMLDALGKVWSADVREARDAAVGKATVVHNMDIWSQATGANTEHREWAMEKLSVVFVRVSNTQVLEKLWKVVEATLCSQWTKAHGHNMGTFEPVFAPELGRAEPMAAKLAAAAATGSSKWRDNKRWYTPTAGQPRDLFALFQLGPWPVLRWLTEDGNPDRPAEFGGRVCQWYTLRSPKRFLRRRTLVEFEYVVELGDVVPIYDSDRPRSPFCLYSFDAEWSSVVNKSEYLDRKTAGGDIPFPVVHREPPLCISTVVGNVHPNGTVKDVVYTLYVVGESEHAQVRTAAFAMAVADASNVAIPNRATSVDVRLCSVALPVPPDLDVPEDERMMAHMYIGTDSADVARKANFHHDPDGGVDADMTTLRAAALQSVEELQVALDDQTSCVASRLSKLGFDGFGTTGDLGFAAFVGVRRNRFGGAIKMLEWYVTQLASVAIRARVFASSWPATEDEPSKPPFLAALDGGRAHFVAMVRACEDLRTALFQLDGIKARVCAIMVAPPSIDGEPPAKRAPVVEARVVGVALPVEGGGVGHPQKVRVVDRTSVAKKAKRTKVEAGGGDRSAKRTRAVSPSQQQSLLSLQLEAVVHFKRARRAIIGLRWCAWSTKQDDLSYLPASEDELLALPFVTAHRCIMAWLESTYADSILGAIALREWLGVLRERAGRLSAVPIVFFSTFDLSTSLEHPILKKVKQECRVRGFQMPSSVTVRRLPHGREAELMLTIIHERRRLAPAVVAGHNIDGFDMPAMVRYITASDIPQGAVRAMCSSTLLGGSVMFEGDSRPIGGSAGGFVHPHVSLLGPKLDGKCVDNFMHMWLHSGHTVYLDTVKRSDQNFSKDERDGGLSLTAIASRVLGFGKMGIGAGSVTDAAYQMVGGMGAIGAYCVVDSLLVFLLVVTKEIYSGACSLANRYNVLPQVCLQDSKQTAKTMALSVREGLQLRAVNGIVRVVDAHNVMFGTGQGGLVYDPKYVGIVADPVAVVDFNSLYPSIMRSFNIDPMTSVTPEVAAKVVAMAGPTMVQEHTLSLLYEAKYHPERRSSSLAPYYDQVAHGATKRVTAASKRNTSNPLIPHATTVYLIQTKRGLLPHLCDILIELRTDIRRRLKAKQSEVRVIREELEGLQVSTGCVQCALCDGVLTDADEIFAHADEALVCHRTCLGHWRHKHGVFPVTLLPYDDRHWSEGVDAQHTRAQSRGMVFALTVDALRRELLQLQVEVAEGLIGNMEMRQKAVKVVNNSLYGLTMNRSAYSYQPVLGSLICSIGRESNIMMNRMLAEHQRYRGWLMLLRHVLEATVLGGSWGALKKERKWVASALVEVFTCLQLTDVALCDPETWCDPVIFMSALQGQGPFGISEAEGSEGLDRWRWGVEATLLNQTRGGALIPTVLDKSVADVQLKRDDPDAVQLRDSVDRVGALLERVHTQQYLPQCVDELTVCDGALETIYGDTDSIFVRFVPALIPPLMRGNMRATRAWVALVSTVVCHLLSREAYF